jgi:hypothetical protein
LGKEKLAASYSETNFRFDITRTHSQSISRHAFVGHSYDRARDRVYHSLLLLGSHSGHLRRRLGSISAEKLLSKDEAAKDRGEYCQVARAITQDLIRGPSYNGSLVVLATGTRSLRLHLHAETVKKITHEKLESSSFRPTSARLFRSRRRKGRSLDGQRSTEH